VHTTTIGRTDAPECGPGAVRIDAEGHDARGRIRAAHVTTIAVEGDRTVTIGTSACEAQVEVTLEDGTSLSVTRGAVAGHLFGGTGLDATVEGSVIDAAGVPTTVGGHIVLSPAT